MTLILELPDNKGAALNARARAHGVSAVQFAEQVLNHALEQGEPTSTVEPPLRRRHISETIRERMRNIPTEVWAALPTDGASEHDHYIYGLPRKTS